MNAELLQQIKAQILEEPDRFRMDEWNCGTAQCIAGWACSLTGGTWVKREAETRMNMIVLDGTPPDEWGWMAVEQRACQVLGISPKQGERLFIDEEWPVEFAERYLSAESRAERAGIAAERIDAFIAADGIEDYESYADVRLYDDDSVDEW